MMNKVQFIQDQLAYEATLGLSNEAAVTAVENRYDLVLIGARRARELGRGDISFGQPQSQFRSCPASGRAEHRTL